MSKAGLTHGGFYAHFKSKDDLIIQSIPIMFKIWHINLSEKLNDHHTENKASGFIDIYLSETHRNDKINCCPLSALSSDVTRLPVEAQKRYLQGFETTVKEFSKKLSFIQHEEREKAAKSVILEMMSALAIAKAATNEGECEKILAATRSEIKKRLKIV